jgi:general secretion pathway protein N
MTSFFDSLDSKPAKVKAPKARRFGAKSAFAESTLQEQAWIRTRSAGLRWGIAGAVFGSLLGLALFAPASWLARVVSNLTNERVMLTDARGTLWNGDAVAVLTGGPGSRTASSLPGRLAWKARPGWGLLNVAFTHACCINGTATVKVQPGLGRTVATLTPPAGTTSVGQWPAGWLAGMGTPWNTLQMGGMLKLATQGLTVESVQGRTRLDGALTLELSGASAKLSTLPTLGSYRINVRGDATTNGIAAVKFETIEGPLLVTGDGELTGVGLRFRGEARAADGHEESLSNLLNIIGRRQGAVSVLSIG